MNPELSIDSVTEPEAAALLREAVATYSGIEALRLHVNSSNKGLVKFLYERPDKLVMEGDDDGQSGRLVVNGADAYSANGDFFSRSDARDNEVLAVIGGSGRAISRVLSALLDGKDPMAEIERSYAKMKGLNFTSRTVLVEPRVVEGETLCGVKNDLSFDIPWGEKLSHRHAKRTIWFGGSPLMVRRVESSFTRDGEGVSSTDIITEQELDATFPADTFTFDAFRYHLDPDHAPPFDGRLKRGGPAFPFEAQTLDGTTVSLESYKGKVLLLHFWATWCGPCHSSIEHLKELYAKYHPQGLEILGISLDEKEALASFLEREGIQWPQVCDELSWDGKVRSLYGIKGIPQSFLLGKDGTIASIGPVGYYYIEGADGKSQKLSGADAIIEAALAR